MRDNNTCGHEFNHYKFVIGNNIKIPSHLSKLTEKKKKKKEKQTAEKKEMKTL